MTKIFWAKSNPKETVQEHTDNLLKNLDVFKELYPSQLAEWDIALLLEKACLFHDIGKINDEFQTLIGGKHIIQKLPHGIYSLCFLDADNLCDELEKRYEESGENNPDKKAEAYVTLLANAIARHHDRDIANEWREIVKKNLEGLKNIYQEFEYDKITDKNVELISMDFFTKGRGIMPGDNLELFLKYVFIKGMLNRIDYAASAGIVVEKRNDFLSEKLDKMMQEWKNCNPLSDWNELQRYMINMKDENVITVAQTGMGKTEAGLLWIGDTKGFFILPLKTAINAIYDRIKNGIVHDHTEERVGLLHSETREIYLQEKNKSQDNINLDNYYESTKQLSLPLTVCTLDQIFDFVYRYRGFEAKLATLSYSKIVLDEIQMYAPELLAYVIKGIQYMTEMGGKFCILTATFPAIVGDLLEWKGIEFKISPNFTKKDLPLRHNVKVLQKLIDTDDIIKKYDNNKILVICNTVKEAQRVYDELLNKISDKENLNMFHSKFTKADRREKEKAILSIGNKKSKEKGIWVATQVVEASLDIDFDILFTELSDINGLFQRMGRCYRNRPLKGDEINCYVYVGTETDQNTGVGKFIDKKIYELSRSMTINEIDGKLDEEKKMNCVAELYTKEKLQNSEYYKKVIKTIEYLETIDPYEKSKTDVAKEFRNIISYPIIPKDLYEKNKKEIEEYLEIISRPYTQDRNKRENERKEKLIAKMQIRDFTLGVQDYELMGGNKSVNLGIFEKIKLGKYEEIYILDCYYDFETGFKIKKQSEKKEDNFL
ncbi:CRISPR-associated helicase Cas3' [Fusobacterium sp.]|uniref:CRISPR-associated helicase Cas3' n=1 Tax=Fusobacterium sp. TaxID=68766 RepID=UPI00396C8E5C